MNDSAIGVAVGVAIASIVGAFQFVINVLVKQGKIETRLATHDRDLRNLGDKVREIEKEKQTHRRNAA